MKYRKLGNTGLEVSILGYGASPLGSVFREIDESEGIRTVHEALDLGINLIDVSPYYGLTRAETVLGKALRDVPRDRYILSTKAGRYDEDSFDFSADRIFRSVEESMKRLHVDYIDILHLHDIEFGDLEQIIEESIPALERLKEQGKIRFYGVTGLPLKVFEKVLDRVHVDAIISYCHYSLNDTSLADMLPYFQEKGTGVINASPLSMGLLSERGAPDWHPADEEIRKYCKMAADFCAEQGENIAKLALQFSVSNENIPTTLTGTANPVNIRNNVKWIGEPMDEQLLKEVQNILQPIMNKTWPSGREENQH